MEEDGADKKSFLILRRYIPVLSAAPYSRHFFIVGSLAKNYSPARSDIDIVMICKKKRVWANRLIILFLIFILGKKRSKRKRSGRFCLNASFQEIHEAEDFLKNFYKNYKRVDYEPLFTIKFLKNIAEFFLEIFLIGAFLELVSKKIISGYIRRRFSVFSEEEKFICVLEDNKIIYHPPK